MTRPPRFQLRAWHMEKLALQPSHFWGGLGYLFHIAGVGHLAITVQPVPSHSPFTAAPSAMPPSSLPNASDVRLGQGPLLGSPPGPPLPTGRSASTPLISSIRGRRSGPQSGTPLGPWTLRQSVLLQPRTPSSSQGAFFWVREGQALLFHGQLSDSSPRCYLYKSLEEIQNTGYHRKLFYDKWINIT